MLAVEEATSISRARVTQCCEACWFSVSVMIQTQLPNPPLGGPPPFDTFVACLPLWTSRTCGLTSDTHQHSSVVFLVRLSFSSERDNTDLKTLRLKILLAVSQSTGRTKEIASNACRVQNWSPLLTFHCIRSYE